MIMKWVRNRTNILRVILIINALYIYIQRIISKFNVDVPRLLQGKGEISFLETVASGEQSLPYCWQLRFELESLSLQVQNKGPLESTAYRSEMK